jgi:acetylglutamate kinase
MDNYRIPNPDAMPTVKPFLGRPVVMRIDEAATHSATLFSDIVFMRALGVRPVIVHDAQPRETSARLVAAINRIGGDAVGIDGTSANTLALARREDGGIELRSVNPGLVALLLDRGYIPVFASEGSEISGATAPIDADEAARGLAAAVGAIRLLFSAAPGGVPADGAGIIDELTSSEALALAASGSLDRDLSRHLVAAALGVRAGVAAAQILDLSMAHASLIEMLTARHAGTQVVSRVVF